MSATDPDGQGEPTGDSDPPGEEAATDGHRDRRSTFATWRRSRPFWGGVFAVLGGVELILIPLAPMPVVIHQGIAGISSYLIGALLAVIGLLLWFQPNQRTFYGIVAVLLSLASFVTSNFGGFVVGELLGLVGGALGFAWMPGGSSRGRGRRHRLGFSQQRARRGRSCIRSRSRHGRRTLSRNVRSKCSKLQTAWPA